MNKSIPSSATDSWARNGVGRGSIFDLTLDDLAKSCAASSLLLLEIFACMHVGPLLQTVKENDFMMVLSGYFYAVCFGRFKNGGIIQMQC